VFTQVLGEVCHVHIRASSARSLQQTICKGQIE
jgi:hypothetical protein